VNLTRFTELSRRFDLERAALQVRSPIEPGDVVRVVLPVSSQALADAVTAAQAAYSPSKFASVSDQQSCANYESISLAFNPDSAVKPLHSTLGSAALTSVEHYYATPATLAKIGSLRDSYYDTYGFRLPTTAASKELALLTSKLKRSLVRSRMSVMRAGSAATSGFYWGWHKDESVFENLRINIHVTDSPDHRIQVMREDRKPASMDDAALTEHHFEVGYGYSWDTHLPHRACSVGVPKQDRTAIVLGVSPWFDYDAQADAWTPNEFFGRKHPFAMLRDGDVL